MDKLILNLMNEQTNSQSKSSFDIQSLNSNKITENTYIRTGQLPGPWENLNIFKDKDFDYSMLGKVTNDKHKDKDEDEENIFLTNLNDGQKDID